MSAPVKLPDGPDNLVELFEKSVEKNASHLLFGTKNSAGTGYDWITYGEVADRVNKFRGGLASLGVKKGDGVAIIANNRVEWAIAAYATYGLRARFIPMYEAELPRIMKYIVENSKTKVLLVSRRDIYEKVKDFPKEVKSLKKILIIEDEGADSMAAMEKIGAAKPAPSERPSGSDVAGFIYTSGTTGNPKGVVLTHRNLSSNVLAIRACFPQFDHTTRTLSFLPWAHSFGQIAELHLLVHMGGSTGFAEKPETIVGDMLLVKPTLLVAVPRIFNRVYDGLQTKMNEQGGLAKFLFEMGIAAGKARREKGGKAGLVNGVKFAIADKIVFSKIRAKFGGQLKMAVSSSAALNTRIAYFFSDIGIPVYEAWGMTELSPAHTVNTPERNKPGSVGFPIPGSWVTIDKSQTGKDSPDGEIIAYGPNVMVGYHELPNETAEVLRPDGGLATGDRGWADADGHVFITGRLKEQYKLENGKYVFPVGLEESIKLSPYIENVMVHGANRQYNVALVIPDFANLAKWAKENGISESPEALAKNPKAEALILAEINKHCGEFARYEVPSKVLLISEAFTSANGMLTQTLKLKRREVMKKHGEQLEALYGQERA